MAAAKAELKWLKNHMGQPVDEKTRGLALDQMISDQCAQVVDGEIFVTRKGQRLMAHFDII